MAPLVDDDLEKQHGQKAQKEQAEGEEGVARPLAGGCEFVHVMGDAEAADPADENEDEGEEPLLPRDFFLLAVLLHGESLLETKLVPVYHIDIPFTTKK